MAQEARGLRVTPTLTRALVPSLSCCLTAEGQSAFSTVSVVEDAQHCICRSNKNGLPASPPSILSWGALHAQHGSFLTAMCPLESRHSKAPDRNTLILNLNADEEDR